MYKWTWKLDKCFAWTSICKFAHDSLVLKMKCQKPDPPVKAGGISSLQESLIIMHTVSQKMHPQPEIMC